MSNVKKVLIVGGVSFLLKETAPVKVSRDISEDSVINVTV
jgi:hypothetical protein